MGVGRQSQAAAAREKNRRKVLKAIVDPGRRKGHYTFTTAVLREACKVKTMCLINLFQL